MENPRNRRSQTIAHKELLKRLPPLRKSEARFREIATSIKNPVGDSDGSDEALFVDNEDDEDWKDPRKTRKRRTEPFV